MTSLQGRTALVTGGARGIGLAIAQAYARAGAAVAICDVLEEDGAAAVDALEQDGSRAMFVHMDVGDPRSVGRAVTAIDDRLGRLDFAVNNAAVRSVAPVADLPTEEWDAVLRVNLSGVFYCMKYQLPHLIRTGGSIVNVASIWGLDGWPGRSAYVASKHGVVGLTKSAAHEYGEQGVRVNAVAPGPIETDAALSSVTSNGQALQPLIRRTAQRSLGQPQDVAEAVVWLSTARNVTGTVLPVDGGWGAI